MQFVIIEEVYTYISADDPQTAMDRYLQTETQLNDVSVAVQEREIYVSVNGLPEGPPFDVEEDGGD